MTIFCLLALLLMSNVCHALPLKLVQLDHVAWTAKDGAPLGIGQLQQDIDGTLWLAGDSGLYNFNGLSFSPFQSLPGDVQLPSMPIRALYVARDGALWVGLGIKGIAKIRSHRVVRLYDDVDGLPIGEVREIIEAPDGTIVAVAKSQLVELRGDRWAALPAAGPMGDEDVKAALFDRSGNLWVGTGNSVWKLPSGGIEFLRTKEGGGYPTRFAESPDGSIWVNLPSKGPLLTVPHCISSCGEKPLSNFGEFLTLNFVFDSDGLMWLGTSNRGIVRVFPRSPPKPGGNPSTAVPFDTYDHNDGLTSNTVNPFLEDSAGDIWVGTTSGLDRFRKPNLVRLVDKRVYDDAMMTQCQGGDLWLASPEQPLLSLHDEIVTPHGPKVSPMYLHCDSTGAIWLTGEEGLRKYTGDRIQAIPLPPGIDSDHGRQIVGDSEHLLFVSITRNGLWRYVDGKWSQVVADGFPEITPFSLLLDSRKRLWARFIDNRIAVLDGDKGQTFYGDTAAPLGIILVFLESRYGLLVGGSNGIAVLRGDHLQTFQSVDQLALRGSSGLLESSNGDLWSNGLHGIVRIRAREIEQALHDSAYRVRSEPFAEAGIGGPSSQGFELPSAVKDSHGILWFATSNTVVSVDPESIHQSTTPPILSPISMVVDGDPVAGHQMIEPGFHTVRIQYFGAYVQAPEKVTYKYKLDGIDKTWQEVGHRLEAVYTGLRPGSYQFHVAASNGEGIWSRADDSMQFTVLPSFYQTKTFLVLCVLVTIGLIWFGLRLRISRLAATIKLRAEERADERVRIARDLHDTLLQGMQGLMLRLHVAIQEVPDTIPTRQLLDAILGRADTIVVEARDRVSRLRLDSFAALDLAQSFRTIGSELNYNNEVNFKVDASGAAMKLHPHVIEELHYIGREAITNAFRHAHAKHIEVKIAFERRAVVLRVSDDGCGFHPEPLTVPPERHWGLLGMMERAHRIRARFECKSEPGSGTTISVLVPSRRAYVNPLSLCRATWKRITKM